MSERDDLRRALMDAERELVHRDVELAEVKDALRETEQAGRAITATLVALHGWLDKPYPDDPRWTPWTRFVERDLGRLEVARKRARAALAAAEGTDA